MNMLKAGQYPRRWNNLGKGFVAGGVRAPLGNCEKASVAAIRASGVRAIKMESWAQNRA